MLLALQKKKSIHQTKEALPFYDKEIGSSNYMEHLRSNHLDEPRVSDAMAMENGKRCNAVQQICLEAMKKINQIRLAEGKEPIQIRNQASSTSSSYCDTCNRFFKKFHHPHPHDTSARTVQWNKLNQMSHSKLTTFKKTWSSTFVMTAPENWHPVTTPT